MESSLAITSASSLKTLGYILSVPIELDTFGVMRQSQTCCALTAGRFHSPKPHQDVQRGMVSLTANKDWSKNFSIFVEARSPFSFIRQDTFSLSGLFWPIYFYTSLLYFTSLTRFSIHIPQNHELNQGIVTAAQSASILNLFNDLLCTGEQQIQ